MSSFSRSEVETIYAFMVETLVNQKVQRLTREQIFEEFAQKLPHYEKNEFVANLANAVKNNYIVGFESRKGRFGGFFSVDGFDYKSVSFTHVPERGEPVSKRAKKEVDESLKSEVESEPESEPVQDSPAEETAKVETDALHETEESQRDDGYLEPKDVPPEVRDRFYSTAPVSKSVAKTFVPSKVTEPKVDIYVMDKHYEVNVSPAKMRTLLVSVLNMEESETGEVLLEKVRYTGDKEKIETFDRFLFYFYSAKYVVTSDKTDEQKNTAA